MQSTNPTVPYCRATFDEQQRRQFLNDNAKVLKILEDGQCWDFSKHKFNDNVAKFMKQLPQRFDPKISQLRLSSNRRPSIMVEIGHLDFRRLKMLDVGSTSLVSIEWLPCLYMPSLERLNFYNNLITNIEPLRKCDYPFLIYLSFMSNVSINSMKSLHKMHAPNLLWLWAEHKQKEWVEDQNIRWFFKLEGIKLSQLVLRSKKRIKERKLMNQFVPKKLPDCIIRHEYNAVN